MLLECPNRPTTNPNSPGSIILAPVGSTGNDPPFTFGDSFNYVCEDSVNFILNPANPFTSCQVDGTFTLDGNPPTCEQISKYRIFMFSQTDNCFFFITVKQLKLVNSRVLLALIVTAVVALKCLSRNNNT